MLNIGDQVTSYLHSTNNTPTSTANTSTVANTLLYSTLIKNYQNNLLLSSNASSLASNTSALSTISYSCLANLINNNQSSAPASKKQKLSYGSTPFDPQLSTPKLNTDLMQNYLNISSSSNTNTSSASFNANLINDYLKKHLVNNTNSASNTSALYSLNYLNNYYNYGIYNPTNFNGSSNSMLNFETTPSSSPSKKSTPVSNANATTNIDENMYNLLKLKQNEYLYQSNSLPTGKKKRITFEKRF
jgi:hypothetical protein